MQTFSFPTEKHEFYREFVAAFRNLVSNETDQIAILATAASMIHEYVPNVMWAGFYILRDKNLVLGPFHGPVACFRIPMGRGVCGVSADKNETLVVPDVDAFPGHIACSSASRSEIAIPIHNSQGLWGVLDIDAPILGRFQKEDQIGLEEFAKILEEKLG